MNIDSIHNGIVLDHIKAGKSMEIYKFLNLDALTCYVAIIKNVNSRKMGKKDIIKIDTDLDVLYMTRVQRERFFNEEDYLRLKDSYILTPEKLQLAKDDMIILHPLPRVNEIAVAVDDDPRACYFRQALNGKYVRMALIMKLLEVH